MKRESIHIGDTPADIRCARVGGGRVIAVATGACSTEMLARHQPDHLFADFSQTTDVLQVLFTPAMVTSVQEG